MNQKQRDKLQNYGLTPYKELIEILFTELIEHDCNYSSLAIELTNHWHLSKRFYARQRLQELIPFPKGLSQREWAKMLKLSKSDTKLHDGLKRYLLFQILREVGIDSV